MVSLASVLCGLGVAVTLAACAEDVPIGRLAGAVTETSPDASSSDVPVLPPSALDAAPAAPEPDARPSLDPRLNAVALFDFRNGAAPPYRDQRGDLTLAIPEGVDAALVRPGTSGLGLGAGGMLASESGAEALTAACMASNELSVEVWVTPEGPQELRSRLVSLSENTTRRNFTLGVGSNDGDPGEGQCADVSRAAFGVGTGPAAYFFRRRLDADGCSTCGTNGYPELWTQLVAESRLTHVVATHAADGTDRIYVDGQVAGECVHSGSFSAWDPNHRLQLGDELVGGDRRFSGVLHVTAIYARALEPAEVGALFASGI